MISAILQENPWMVPTFLAFGLVFGCSMLHIARRSGLSRPLAVLLGWAFAGEIVATLYPIHASADASGACWINRDPFTPLLTQQGVMNMAMYVPLAFLAVALFRRPALITASCVALSATTEMAQAVIPHVGRSCTSEDLVANSLGAGLGAVAAVLVAGKKNFGSERHGILNRKDFSRGAGVVFGSATVVLVIGSLAVTPVLTEVSELTQASSEQQERARALVKKIYGSGSEISSIQHMKGGGGQPGQTLVTLEDGFLNFAESESFVTGSTLAKSLPGVKNRQVETDGDAIRQAESFVRSRFPWALTGSRPMVDPTAPGTGQRTVGWRKRVQGVLMPMRMDVVVEPSGCVSAFTGRNESGPTVPPPHSITLAQAEKIAAKSVPTGKFENSELLVQKNKDGDWETRWAVNYGLPPRELGPEEVPAGRQGASVMIHAGTGKILNVDYGDAVD
ncbi:VanZ family protein [Streptomyces sp. NPDC088729]|uniref:VanZ family protein n=1 Tax=Streptomyces sp. NPDC088729 TaxID=3365876 RepID=UPI0037F63298